MRKDTCQKNKYCELVNKLSLEKRKVHSQSRSGGSHTNCPAKCIHSPLSDTRILACNALSVLLINTDNEQFKTEREEN